MRRKPGEHERHAVAGRDGEVRDRAHVLAVGLDWRAKAETIRPRDRDERVVDAPDPRDDPAEVEPDHELGAHLDLAGEAFDDADDVGRAPARRHEVDHADAPAGELVHRLEDERVVAVAPRRPHRRSGRREQPASVILGAEEGGEAGARVEAREATPVDGAVAADERHRLEVADQPVVLDQRHGSFVQERLDGRVVGSSNLWMSRSREEEVVHMLTVLAASSVFSTD